MQDKLLCSTDCVKIQKKTMADLQEDSVEVKPSIIMKVDAPPEDNNTITSQGGSVNSSADQNNSIKTPVKTKKPILATSKLNNSPLMRPSVLSSPKLNSGVVLRPSALGSRVENNKPKEDNPKNFTLCPSRLNPVAKADHPEENNCEEEKSEVNNGETPKFVPLAVTEPSKTTTTSSTTSVASTSNFVFGQNLHERVVSENEESSENGDSSNACASNSSANGTSELLFTSAVKNTQQDNKEVKTLSESAREYEESRANKRKYETVTVVTGEEDETNILQINCKLFAFDKNSGNWQERGRGTLRLNDKDSHSRLVFRTAGSLRLVLNTKIWAEMTVDRASGKSLRLTAMDASGQIKVFLIMASSEEINQLQRLLEARLTRLKETSAEPLNKKPSLDMTH